MASKTNRVFTLSRIAQQPAGDCKFLQQGRDGQPDKMVFVPEYFQKVHNVHVTKPRLVCLSFPMYSEAWCPSEAWCLEGETLEQLCHTRLV